MFVGAGKYICLLNSSIIEVVENNSVSELLFNFIGINEIKNLSPNSKCGNFIVKLLTLYFQTFFSIDIIAVIAKNWGTEVVGDNKRKLDLSLTDQSKVIINLSLWGSEYNEFDFEETVVIIHNAVVHEYNGDISLNCAARTL